jgi:predicted Zn-ribbon and HTH transcriptional regulator
MPPTHPFPFPPSDETLEYTTRSIFSLCTSTNFWKRTCQSLPHFHSYFWSTDTKTWTKRFKEINQCHLKSVSACFKKYINGQASFETARDTIRNELDSQSPAQLPHGTRCTSVSALASAILAAQNFVTISCPECTNCGYSETSIDDILDFVLYEKEDTPKSTSHRLRSLEHKTHERCPECFSAMIQPISFKSATNVLIFEINSRNIKLSKTLKFEQERETVVLNVKGLIYLGDFHYYWNGWRCMVP